MERFSEFSLIRESIEYRDQEIAPTEKGVRNRSVALSENWVVPSIRVPVLKQRNPMENEKG